ncbi:MFS transporter [Paenibacillus prosopidis]|uniref:MFS transporter n=1 Tax=Paenibacillus prosopidis TaxID=630520 RepID=UPI001C69F95A|nr:MFS transporter [Paenibacillus prosopidis]
MFVSAIMYWIGFSMLRPMVALYFESAGYTTALIGLIMALGAIIPVLFAMPAGSIIDRIGVRRSVLSGSALMLASGVLYWLGGSLSLLWPILGGQVMLGLGSLLSWGALQASAAITSDGEGAAGGRERLLPNFAFANSIAQFTGPLLGGLLADFGSYTSVYASFTVLSLVSGLLALFLPAKLEISIEAEGDTLKAMKLEENNGMNSAMPRAREEAPFHFWRSYSSGYLLLKGNRPFYMAIFLNAVLFVLVDVKGTFVPLYLAAQNLSNTKIGSILSISGAASLLIRPFIGLLLRLLGHHYMMIGSILLGAFCLLVLALQPPLWMIIILLFSWGICTGVNQPMALIMVARNVEKHEQGMGMSLRTMSNRLVQVANPLVFGLLSGTIGIALGFGVFGIGLIALAGITHRMSRNTSMGGSIAGKNSRQGVRESG